MFNWKIGVVHNPGMPFRVGKMRDIASQNSFNVLVYGHTHNASIKWIENNLFINPGSPTNPIPPFITKPTVALLRITPQTITPEIIRV
jgi:putative phosphoesterase